MPYVIQEKRPRLNNIVNLMEAAGVKADGDLNYILFKFCKYNVPKSYNSIKNFNAELLFLVWFKLATVNSSGKWALK